MRTTFRVLGLVLVGSVVFPLYPLARPGTAGSPAEHLRSLAASYHEAFLLGLISIALLAILLGLSRFPRRIGELLEGSVRSLLLAPSGQWFALAAGVLAGTASLGLSVFLFSLEPVLVDASSQLVHARYVASGRLAGPELALPEFFTFQYMVNLPAGWASQYPPGHIVLLALGFMVGTPWLIGPLLAGLTVALTARIGETLLPGDPIAARTGTLFLSLSLFFLGHSATYMNHVTAAAFGSLGLLGVLRGRGDGPRANLWLAIAGCAVGIVVATRPLAGTVVGLVAFAALVIPQESGTNWPEPRATLRKILLFGAGLIPFSLALAGYNHRLFGSATRFGYVEAEGPGHGMGFHTDPWGNLYTPVEGLVQASTDLLALGMDLLTTPISAVFVVGLYLLLGRHRDVGSLGILLLWGLLPILAHVFYWHHDLVMGPRLLTEFAPAWALLTAVAVVGLVRQTRKSGLILRRVDPYGVVVAAFLLSAITAVGFLIPNRVAVYHLQWGVERQAMGVEMERPTLVFVHGGWEGRLGSRLAAQGMRGDSIRLALQHNTSCEVQQFLDARDRRGAERTQGPLEAMSSDRSPRDLHFDPRPGVVIEQVQIVPGVVVRTFPGEDPDPECMRQANADRHGTLSLSSVIWRGDLPGLPPKGGLFARDFGPERNRRLIDAHPGREPWVYVRPEPGAVPLLRPYEEGMLVLWQQETP